MKSNIIAITGLSGSGKSTIARKVSEQMSIPLVTTVTTRPIRPGEKDGVDYIFYNKEVYEALKESGQIIADETFKVASGETWSYGIRKEDLVGKKRVILVLSPQEVKDLKTLGYNVVSLYIYINEEKRIERRSIEDKIKFKNFNPNYIIDNNNSLNESIGLLNDYIIEEIIDMNI